MKLNTKEGLQAAGRSLRLLPASILPHHLVSAQCAQRSLICSRDVPQPMQLLARTHCCSTAGSGRRQRPAVLFQRASAAAGIRHTPSTVSGFELQSLQLAANRPFQRRDSSSRARSSVAPISDSSGEGTEYVPPVMSHPKFQTQSSFAFAHAGRERASGCGSQLLR